MAAAAEVVVAAGTAGAIAVEAVVAAAAVAAAIAATAGSSLRFALVRGTANGWAAFAEFGERSGQPESRAVTGVVYLGRSLI